MEDDFGFGMLGRFLVLEDIEEKLGVGGREAEYSPRGASLEDCCG